MYFIILITYYFTGKAQLTYKWSSIVWEELIKLVKTGVPGALLVFCIPLIVFCDATGNIGLRKVTNIAKDMEYRNLMGLNVLTINLGAT